MEIKVNDNTSVYQSDIDIYTQSYIDLYCDGEPSKLIENKKLLPDLLKYLYNNCICNILDNKHNTTNRYNDFILLDNLWDIFTSICHKYNSNVNILLFSVFTGISRETISKWNNNRDRELTPQQIHIVKKWYNESELDLVQGSSVFDIFMLKSNYNYNDNIQSRPDENVQKITANTLPLLENNEMLLKCDD